jgi:low affinity Fe/Cu permease
MSKHCEITIKKKKKKKIKKKKKKKNKKIQTKDKSHVGAVSPQRLILRLITQSGV